jgi:hypothetical protein
VAAPRRLRLGDIIATMFNPLRSEDDAFRALMYIVACLAAIVVIVVVARVI